MNKIRRASLRKTMNSLDLSEAEEVLKSKYKYVPGEPGRPPLSPVGMFLSFTIMFLRMESYRDYQAFLEKDKFWRRTLGFKKTPDIGNYSHFLNRIGKETFEQLFQVVVQQLLNEGFLNLHILAIDGSILEGNPDDKQADWGWDHIEEVNVYGYKIHVLVDVKKELPVAVTFTQASDHDSTQFKPLYQQMKSYHTRFPNRYFIGDKAFDAAYIRQLLFKDEVKPIIKASKTPIKPIYPGWFIRIYRKRTSVERFFSRLKEYLDLKKLQIYGKSNLQIYTYIFIIGMLLIGYINHSFGYSPRSVKTFMRKLT
jgi:transposase